MSGSATIPMFDVESPSAHDEPTRSGRLPQPTECVSLSGPGSPSSPRIQRSQYGRFYENPVIELLDDGRLVEVTRWLNFEPCTGRRITVPPGFRCDGASIPRIAWPLSGGPFEGRHRDAAIIHDYLYQRGREGTPLVDRATADRIFYDAMRCCGVPWWSAMAKYAAVRLFGPRWSIPTNEPRPL